MQHGPRGAVPLIPEGAQKTSYIGCQSRLSPASDLKGTPKIWAYSLRRFMARWCICLSARVSLPWMVLACAQRSLPSFVRGPVLIPP
jgi:hypothetical protein